MNHIVRKTVYLALSLLSLALHYALTLGVSATIIHGMGVWALLVNFLWMSLGTVVILGFSAALARGYPRIAHHLGVRTAVDPNGYKTRFWLWVRAKGMFPMALAATWLGTPLIAANILRAFAIKERRAWTYGLVSNAIVSTAAVALYHGGAEVIRSLFHVHGAS